MGVNEDSHVTINNSLTPESIGLCFKDGSEYSRFAFIEFSNKDRIVSTIEFYTGDGLTIGEYFDGRVSDYEYCVRNNDESSMNAEFELWSDKYHSEDLTSEHGVESIRR